MYYEWPGNVRELQNAIERALIVSQSDSICSGDLPVHFLRAEQDNHHAITNPVRLAEIEKAAILDALADNEGNRQSTAEQLGISLRTLQYRLKEYGLAGRE
jgi:DNA-binding NtrC family response regulator